MLFVPKSVKKICFNLHNWFNEVAKFLMKII